MISSLRTVLEFFLIDPVIFFRSTGECYSGPDAHIAYNKDGPSNQCVTRDFKECPTIRHGHSGNQQDCVGMEGSNYVYQIVGIKQEQATRRTYPSKVRLRKPSLIKNHSG